MDSTQILHTREIKKRLGSLPTWEKNSKAIKRSVLFESFHECVDFVCILAELSDSMEHHPDIEIRENTVTLYCSSHSANGITGVDFDLAHRIEGLITETVVDRGDEDMDEIDEAEQLFGDADALLND